MEVLDKKKMLQNELKNFTAVLAIDFIYEFHRRSGLKLIFSTRSEHGTSLRGQISIVTAEKS